LEKLFASSGEEIPNRIPVKRAVDILIAEYRSPQLAYRCDFQSEFGSAVTDPERAKRTLALAAPGVSSDADLARELARQAPNNGFAVGIEAFSAQQWNQLRACTVSQ
jgi:hypothetical protein